jgi:glycosyltransferase involved in cell wall biosynthesis
MPSTISVVVCTRNGGLSAVRALQAVLACVSATNTEVEVLAIDNGSTDCTRALLDELAADEPDLRIISEPRPGLSRARNAGLRAALGDVLVFTDDDCVPEPAWLEKLTAPLMANACDVVAGGVVLAPELDRAWFTAFHRQMVASTEDGLGNPPRSLVGANMAFRRVVVDGLEFDERLGAGALGAMEESLFFEQLLTRGARASFVPGAVVVHHFDPSRLSPQAFVRRAYVQGRGEGWMHWNWGAAGYTPRSYLRWLRLELHLARSGGIRHLAGSPDDLALVREIGRRREYTASRWGRRDTPVPHHGQSGSRISR